MCHFLPIHTPAEILDMRAACFPHLDVEGVERRIRQWGPLPSHVLVHTRPLHQRCIGRRDLVDAQHRRVLRRAAGQDATPGTPAADPSRQVYYGQGALVLAPGLPS